MILLHDTYFYWTHRAMHHPKIYRHVHLVHHLSQNPSPWAAFAFHPFEAVIEAGIVVLIAFLFPFHLSALLTFLLFMTVYNAYGHLGFELYPIKFHASWIGRWINTSVIHNKHHEKFNGNYGLYFCFGTAGWEHFAMITSYVWINLLTPFLCVEYCLPDRLHL